MQNAFKCGPQKSHKKQGKVGTRSLCLVQACSGLGMFATLSHDKIDTVVKN